MAFNIHALDDLYYDENPRAFEKYRDDLLDLFLDSLEGQECARADPNAGFWAHTFIECGTEYCGVTIPQTRVNDAEELLEEIFPRKVSVLSPDEANYTIPELIAFWQYLRREFELPNADAILSYLQKLEPGYKEILNDPRRFGMAKTFVMKGQSMGFDMTNEEEVSQFMHLYNTVIRSEETVIRSEEMEATSNPNVLGPPPGLHSPPSRKKTRKKKKGRVRTSRRQRKKKRR